MTVVVFDVLRLALAPFSATPRGIDRIDIGYAARLFEAAPFDCVGLLPTPIGPRWFSREQALRSVRVIERMWDDEAGAGSSPVFAAVANWLSTGAKQETPRADPDSLGASLRRAGRMLRANPISLGRGLRSLPKGGAYLNVGQVGLGHPSTLAWLKRRPDIKSVFMIHDVIPLTHPDLVTERNRALHDRIVTTAQQYASALLTPSKTAKDALAKELAGRGVSPPIYDVHLPISDIFLRRNNADPRLAQRPYYVVCGTIEKRKNHMLLLRVWRALVAQFGEQTPCLVIAGALGWQSEELVEFLASNPAVAPFVMIANGLSTSDLRDLMAQARAILAPSLAEGFGLPPIEALALGTPALVSDIPSHKEAAGEFGLFLDPRDEDGWRDTIVALTTDQSFYESLRRRVAAFKPTTWSEHMGLVYQTLASMA